MISYYFKYGVVFLVVVLLQVLVAKEIIIAGLFSPFIYVLFILLLPFETPRYLLLLLGFALGLTIDIFSNTPGIHASATVFMAFLRPEILILLSSRELYEAGTLPRISHYGVSWFFRYSAILILSHHIFLFFIEAFTFSGFFDTLIRALISSVLSIVLIVLSQFILFRN
jgi:rod shape-determining protein MreD